MEISDATVAVTVQDKAGNTQTYRYTGDVATAINTNNSGYLHVAVTVNPTQKRESAERNIPDGRFNR